MTDLEQFLYDLLLKTHGDLTVDQLESIVKKDRRTVYPQYTRGEAPMTEAAQELGKCADCQVALATLTAVFSDFVGGLCQACFQIRKQCRPIVVPRQEPHP